MRPRIRDYHKGEHMPRTRHSAAIETPDSAITNNEYGLFLIEPDRKQKRGIRKQWKGIVHKVLRLRAKRELRESE